MFPDSPCLKPMSLFPWWLNLLQVERQETAAPNLSVWVTIQLVM